MVQSRFRRANGSVRLQKGRRCGFGHSERAYSRSGISCYANREPHVQVRLLVRCSKNDLPSGAEEIPYGKDWRVTGVSLVAIAFVEIVSMDMVCVHFAGTCSAIRILVLILSVYGFVWCLGFVVGSKTMPCYAVEEGIVLRCGITHRVEIPWECVSSVCLKKVELEKRSGLIRSGRHLYLNNASQTNELTLCIYEDPKVTIDGKPSKGAILKISFSADNPSAAKGIIEGYLDK